MNRHRTALTATKSLDVESQKWRASTQASFGPRTYFLCTPRQWLVAIGLGLAVCALAWPWYKEISCWIGATVLLMTITAVHMAFAARAFVPFPHVAMLITGLQYVLAAWLAYYFPPADPTYDIGTRLPAYLSFGAVATIACALGWSLTLPVKQGQAQPECSASPRLLGELDVLFWFGMVSGALGRFVAIESLSFVLVLCANLRYLGVIGRMLVDGPGWKWRVVLTIFMEILLATNTAMFHSLLLWSLSVFVVYLYRFRPPKRFLFASLCAAGLLLPALQQAKWRLREPVASFAPLESSSAEPQASLKALENVWSWVTYLGEGVYSTATGSWDSDFLADAATRYNQGWIINRVMQFVPADEPYARGETLITAAKASLLPRLLAHEKHVAGGKLYMERFAGIRLAENTSMNLGYAGELYANFGYFGGIVGCFLYAVVLGLAFRWVASRASRSPLWWMFVPYVGAIAFKAEEGVAEVLNWIVKAAIVAAAVYWAFPAMRANLSRKAGTPETQLPRRRSESFRKHGERTGRTVSPRKGDPRPETP